MPEAVAPPRTSTGTPGETDARGDRLTELGAAFRHAFRSLRSLRGRDTHRGDEIGHAQSELLIELYANGAMHAGELAEAVEAAEEFVEPIGA